MNKGQPSKYEHCWVISDGRLGHEIQSITLAQTLSVQHSIHRFKLRQPWLSFAPRIIPKFGKGLIWNDSMPDLRHVPNLIISTGRSAAAVGKWLRSQLGSTTHHIQILNPRDRFSHYSAVLVPEHDRPIKHQHVRFHGSIHPFGAEVPEWPDHKRPVTLLMGNPPSAYFKQDFTSDLEQIRAAFSDRTLAICGSPRLNPSARQQIRNLIQTNDWLWLTEADGPNPYHLWRTNSHKLFVTADSINMVNECAAGPIPLSVLGARHLRTPKHQRFIKGLSQRLSDMDSTAVGTPPPLALNQICEHPMIQDLMMSPAASKAG